MKVRPRLKWKATTKCSQNDWALVKCTVIGCNFELNFIPPDFLCDNSILWYLVLLIKIFSIHVLQLMQNSIFFFFLVVGSFIIFWSDLEQSIANKYSDSSEHFQFNCRFHCIVYCSLIAAHKVFLWNRVQVKGKSKVRSEIRIASIWCLNQDTSMQEICFHLCIMHWSAKIDCFRLEKNYFLICWSETFTANGASTDQFEMKTKKSNQITQINWKIMFNVRSLNDAFGFQNPEKYSKIF